MKQGWLYWQHVPQLTRQISLLHLADKQPCSSPCHPASQPLTASCLQHWTLQWHTLMYIHVQWRTVMYSDIQWHTVTYGATYDGAKQNPCWTLEIQPWKQMIDWGQHSAKAASRLMCHWSQLWNTFSWTGRRETGTGKYSCWWISLNFHCQDGFVTSPHSQKNVFMDFLFPMYSFNKHKNLIWTL